ncbi:MAG: sulfotransferase [Caulobacterales bacterium]
MNPPNGSLLQTLASAERALADKDYRAAHALCLEALKIDPTSARAYFLLGALSADHANPAKAAELFDKAIALDPSRPEPWAHRARALLALNRHDDALKSAEAAAAGDPRDALTLDTIGVVLSRTGQHARAVPFFERAIEAGASSANIFYNFGAALQFVGRFDAAAAAYRAAIERDPKLYRAYSALVQLKKQTTDNHHLPALESLFSGARGADEKLHLGHALAKTHEDLGRPVESFAWLLKAKAQKRADIQYDAARDAGYFAAAREAAPRSAHGQRSGAPIFIIGLPRTGTTLLDRILSSHADVTSAGELTAFSLLAKRMTKTQSALVLDEDTLRAAARLDFAKLGADYLAFVRARIGDARRFTDKMPLNFFYAGLIHAALPEARIICLRRHPLDSVLSNFRQLFATSFAYYNYAFGLEETARYYVQFDALMAHWRATLPPDRFMETHYETLVADIEGETRRLLQCVGLGFDPACLSFHENAAPVSTASSVQVRQPLYASSIGRWRAYGGRLRPAAEILFKAGLISAEDCAAAS